MRALVLVLAALVLVAPAAASERHPTLGELENELMCPVCAGETLAQSDSLPAQRIKAYIQRRIAAGDTKSEIKRKLVADWGTRILAAPPRSGFDLLAWRWTRAREPAPETPPPWALNGHPLEPDLERRLDEELARYDG